MRTSVLKPERLEFVDGRSAKFWEVELLSEPIEMDDNSNSTLPLYIIVTRWGRIGSKGQSKEGTFYSPEKARLSVKTQVSAKLRKGYKRVAVTSNPRTTTTQVPRSPAPLLVEPKPMPPEPVSEPIDDTPVKNRRAFRL